MKNFSRLVSFQTSKHKHGKMFCKKCLNGFNSPKRLTIHKQSCKEFDSVRVEMPKFGSVKFKNFSRMMHVPIVGYADFESILKPTSGVKKSTETYQEHLPCGWCFNLVSPYAKFEPVLKRAENEEECHLLPGQFTRSLIQEVKKGHLGLKKKKDCYGGPRLG